MELRGFPVELPARLHVLEEFLVRRLDGLQRTLDDIRRIILQPLVAVLAQNGENLAHRVIVEIRLDSEFVLVPELPDHVVPDEAAGPGSAVQLLVLFRRTRMQAVADDSVDFHRKIVFKPPCLSTLLYNSPTIPYSRRNCTILILSAARSLISKPRHDPQGNLIQWDARTQYPFRTFNDSALDLGSTCARHCLPDPSGICRRRPGRRTSARGSLRSMPRH